jgi:hypothetical protein
LSIWAALVSVVMLLVRHSHNATENGRVRVA